jgi:hypothetical protein
VIVVGSLRASGAEHDHDDGRGGHFRKSGIMNSGLVSSRPIGCGRAKPVTIGSEWITDSGGDAGRRVLSVTSLLSQLAQKRMIRVGAGQQPPDLRFQPPGIRAPSCFPIQQRQLHLALDPVSYL